LCSGGSTTAITRDHKPSDERENERIVKQGGTVIGGRLQGQLGVSRAFGNYEFKASNFLSSEPEIHEVTLTADVEFLVVGCDGLYEQFTNEEIGTFIKNGLGVGKSLETVVDELVAEAIDRGSEDNITVIVVKFEKAYKKLLKKRAKKQSGKSSKGNSLRTSGKISKVTNQIESQAPSEPAKTGLFKKGLSLRTSGKHPAAAMISSYISVVTDTSSHTASTSSDSTSSKKKRRDSKKSNRSSPKNLSPRSDKSSSSTSYADVIEDFLKPSKILKHDFFGRTPLTITG